MQCYLPVGAYYIREVVGNLSRVSPGTRVANSELKHWVRVWQGVAEGTMDQNIFMKQPTGQGQRRLHNS